MATRTNRMWKLVERPVGTFKTTDFAWAEEPVPALADGQVIVRQIYLSLDPASRGWASDVPTYLPPVRLGTPMRGYGVGIVEESRHPGFRPGDYVQGMLQWQLFTVSDGAGLHRFERAPGLPLEAYPAVFSFIGATAYFGLVDIGRPMSGETLVVSAAAGAVGSLVGQIGKALGCRVVGIAGGEEKCRWLTGELGFDGAVDYKRGPVRPRLAQQCPKGIDIYFDNVGGEMLDAALSLINLHGRVVACGFISQYSGLQPPAPLRYLIHVVTRRVRLEGFIVLDYAERFPEAFAALGRWMAEGKLRYRADVVEGLEQAPVAVNRLFDGRNVGKLLVKVSDEPA